ncbi:putative GNAT family acetyltransferase [Xylariaceae sp. FL1019]|nr:putative GNAT family acetyltransferase [Xylariaceae sp. FL1019]
MNSALSSFTTKLLSLLQQFLSTFTIDVLARNPSKFLKSSDGITINFVLPSVRIMPLVLSLAEPDDADRIAAIHMASFASNSMLLAQFPTPSVRIDLQESIRMKTLADIEYPFISVLVVKHVPSYGHEPDRALLSDRSILDQKAEKVSEDTESEHEMRSRVVAFAKWSHPIAGDDKPDEPDWNWPPGTNMDLLNAWVKAAEGAQMKAIGAKPCYHLTFMGTDPAFERRGAASLMVQWGLERCREEGVSAYLESTLDAARFYEKMRFTFVEKFSLRYPAAGRSDYEDTYEEVSFVYHPTDSLD